MEEFQESITETEHAVTQQYFKLQTIGKATQRVPVLILKLVFKYFETIYKIL
jgi:hypothetical protein